MPFFRGRACGFLLVNRTGADATNCSTRPRKKGFLFSGMKYTITVSQIGADRAGLRGKIDIVDLALFDAFRDFANSNRCVKTMHNGRIYFWIEYGSLIAEIPYSGLTTKDAIYRRMKKLASAEIIDFHPDNRKLNKSFFAWGKNYDALITTSKPTDEKPEVNALNLRMKNRTPTDEKPYPYGLKTVPPTDEKPNDQYTNNQETNQSTKPINGAATAAHDDETSDEIKKENKAQRIEREALEALTYLNTLCRRNFSATPENLKFGRGRLQSGATLETLKLVVEWAAVTWKGQMWGSKSAEFYWRPATLFQAEKFDHYRQQAEFWKQGQNGKHNGAASTGDIKAMREMGIYNLKQ